MKTSLPLRVMSPLLVAASAWGLSGCSGDAEAPPAPEAGRHGAEPGGHGGGHEGDEHHARPLNEEDVELPSSFAAGVSRLRELHAAVGRRIEAGELEGIHRVAEEMALVARKTKELARQDVPEERQAEAGRLCNEIAGSFQPLDDAAHAGDQAEVAAIHRRVGDAVGRLGTLAP